MALLKWYVTHHKYSHITPVRKTLHWLSTEHLPVFNAVLLVYKFLQSVIQNNANLFLNLGRVVYNTCRSQIDALLLEVQNIVSFVYKSTKHFSLSFT